MMLIITLRSIIIPLNGYGLPLLLSHLTQLVFFFSFPFSLLLPFATGTRLGGAPEKTGDKMGVMTGLGGRWRWRRDKDEAPKPLDSLNLISAEATCGATEVTR